MDVLISLGTNASYSYSLVAVVHHRFLVRSACGFLYFIFSN